MSNGVNKLILLGNVGGNPEIKAVGDSGKLASFSLATSESYTDKNGNKQEDVEWHNCVCFGKRAEIVEKYVAKGHRLYIEGKVKTRKWEDHDGNNRYTTEVVVNVLVMLSKKE